MASWMEADETFPDAGANPNYEIQAKEPGEHVEDEGMVVADAPLPVSSAADAEHVQVVAAADAAPVEAITDMAITEDVKEASCGAVPELGGDEVEVPAVADARRAEPMEAEPLRPRYPCLLVPEYILFLPPHKTLKKRLSIKHPSPHPFLPCSMYCPDLMPILPMRHRHIPALIL
jgi:hypothetical protein